MAVQFTTVGFRVVDRSGVSCDIEADLGNDVSLGEVAELFGLPAERLLVDGRAASAADSWQAAGLRAGSELRIADTFGEPIDVAPSALLVAIGGIEAGRCVPLREGELELRAGSTPLASILLAADGAHVRTAPAATLHETLDGGYLLSFDRALIALTPSDERPIDLPTPAEVHRSPRRLHHDSVSPASVPGEPDAVEAAPEFSWLLTLAPIPVAVLMAILLRPLYAVFAAMGPIMTTARWAEGQRRHKADQKRFDREVNEHAEALDAERSRYRDDLVRARLRRWASLTKVLAVIDGRRAGLWGCRAADPDAFGVVVGYGATRVPIEAKTGPTEADVFLDPAQLPLTTPHGVDVAADRIIGVVGPSAATDAVARSILMQLCTWQGPADFTFSVASPLSTRRQWRWVQWLPHARPGPPPVAAVDKRNPSLSDKKVLGHLHLEVVAVDSSTPCRIARRPEIDHNGLGTATVVLAPAASDLPAQCRVVLEVDRHDLRMVRPSSGDVVEGLLPVGLRHGCADAQARKLAWRRDPEASDGPAAVPASAQLADLIDAIDDPVAIAVRWDQSDGRLNVPLGVDGAGDFEVDLVADGPHALVAGTTGSGKSEMLRTWIASCALAASPEEVNFVLVDFKGGGAFDRCADLPHVVAAVDDLDPHLAARALRSLKAELRHREEVLRSAAASDIDEYRATGRSLARLVVVIDEFATLAVELPEFLASLVDVAQRGRSLGIHMVLATQRPSGVLDNKIRANTNLRIALRVQEPHDSQDVIGSPEAAAIGRDVPGRAIARFSGSERRTFQVASVSSPRREEGAVNRWRPRWPDSGLALDGKPVQSQSEPTQPAGNGPRTELEVLTAAVGAAFDLRGLAPPRVPWLPPLPEHLDAAALKRGCEEDGVDSGQLCLGLADDPDRQAQPRWSWDPRQGPLLVYGVAATSTAAIAAAAVVELAQFSAPAPQIYVVDADSGSLASLAELPAVGEVMAGDDHERIERLLTLFEHAAAERRKSEAVEQHRLLALVIENYGALSDGLRDAGRQDLADRIVQLFRDGPPVGITMFVSARAGRDIPYRVAQQVEQRLLLRLADPTSYVNFGLRSAEVPPLVGERAVDPVDGTEVQLATWAGGDAAATVSVATAVVPALLEGAPAPRIAVLPQNVGRSLLQRQGPGAAPLELAIGVDGSTLGTAFLSLWAGEHCWVAGPAGSGRTTVLAAIAEAYRDVADLPVLWLGNPESAPPLAGLAVDAASLASFEEGLVLVDDAGMVDKAVADALADLGAARRRHIHIVGAGRPDTFRSMQSWTRVLRAARTGVVLEPSQADGDLARATLPRRFPLAPSVGRGYLVVHGAVSVIQVAQPASNSVDMAEL